MKTTKIFLSLMLVLGGLAVSVQAQRPGGKPMGSPEEMATQLTQRLDSLLALDEAQYEAVYGLSLDQMQRMQQLRQENRGDRAAMRGGMLALRKERNEAMQVILTAEQFEAWQANIETRRDNRQGRAGRSGRGRPGGRN
jgi:Spy/CpxP family protein refolding chaperone